MSHIWTSSWLSGAAGWAASTAGDTADGKIEFLANVLGIAGFILSIILLVVGFITQRGKQRPATQADLERLSATVVELMSERLSETLVASATASLVSSPHTVRQQIGTTRDRVSEDLRSAVRAISAAPPPASQAAAAALLTARPDDASGYFAREARASESRADVVGAAEALHLEAVLLSLRDPEAALAPCLKAVSLRPDDALGWTRLAHLYLRLGRTDEAEDAFGEAHRATKAAAALQSPSNC